MSDSVREEWTKELRLLLDLIQSRPSEAWTRERERIAVLNQLISGKTKTPA